MSQAHLFQLGMDLGTGTTHEEDTVTHRVGTGGHLTVVSDRDVLDESRDDHFIRRDGKVFAGTHLIIEVVDGEGLDDEARIQRAFRECVETCGATLAGTHADLLDGLGNARQDRRAGSLSNAKRGVERLRGLKRARVATISARLTSAHGRQPNTSRSGGVFR